jgi:hypothetical protein|tara:strand:- start:345 stop:536 length:192 start_codon:yes stop_codon:yes gene_type:complete
VDGAEIAITAQVHSEFCDWAFLLANLAEIGMVLVFCVPTDFATPDASLLGGCVGFVIPSSPFC